MPDRSIRRSSAHDEASAPSSPYVDKRHRPSRRGRDFHAGEGRQGEWMALTILLVIVALGFVLLVAFGFHDELMQLATR
jgi:hypothetical protein